MIMCARRGMPAAELNGTYGKAGENERQGKL